MRLSEARPELVNWRNWKGKKNQIKFRFKSDTDQIQTKQYYKWMK